MAGLAQLVERLTAERKVTGSIPGVRPLLRVFKKNWERKGTPFALQEARPSRGSDDYIKSGPISSWRHKKILSSISTLCAKYLDTDK